MCNQQLVWCLFTDPKDCPDLKDEKKEEVDRDIYRDIDRDRDIDRNRMSDKKDYRDDRESKADHGTHYLIIKNYSHKKHFKKEDLKKELHINDKVKL